MTTFDASSFPTGTPDRYLAAFRTIWDFLAQPGDWLTSSERLAVAAEVRSEEPWAGPLDRLDTSELQRNVARRIAQDPATLHRAWFDEVTSQIGLGPYAEIAAIVTQVVPVDRFCLLVGRELEPLPKATPGEPTRVVPAGLSDRGAWLPMDAMPGPNVAAALSYVPTDNMLRLGVVRAMYSGKNFADLTWNDRAMSRAQIELLATKTSEHNKCFY